MKGIILAAGKCTRMGDLCSDKPKGMLLYKDKPILAHIVEAMQPVVEEIYVVIDYKKEVIMDYFKDCVKYVIAENTRGTLDSTWRAIKQINDSDPVVITYSDIIMDPDDYYNLGINKTPKLGIVQIPDVSIGSAVYFDQRHRITEIVEKPPKGTSASFWNSAGLIQLPAWAFFAYYKSYIEMNQDPELNLTRFVSFILKYIQIYAVPVKTWIDLGTKEQYLNTIEKDGCGKKW